MDINAITVALTKALTRYSEIQNTDRYKSLSASVREETISRELSGDIGKLLAAQPEFGADGLVSVCQKTPLSELSCHDPPHFPRQLQPNFVQEDASDRSGWGDWWWTGADLRDAAIGRRSRLLGSGFKG